MNRSYPDNSPDVRIRSFSDGDGTYLLVSVTGLEDGNGPRRMGYAAGRWARDYGRALAMEARAVRAGDADWFETSFGKGKWVARYNIQTSHLPMEDMFRIMKENNK